MNAGFNVKSLLESKRMRKKELIDALGITRQGFEHKLKTGFFKPEELEIVATYLGVHVQDLLKSDINQVSESRIVEKSEDSRTQQLIDKIFDELKMLRQQLQKKDEHIDKLLDMMGKLDPMSDSAKVLNLNAEFKQTA
jgi:DNA-binding Xre family transcriptional regulator